MYENKESTQACSLVDAKALSEPMLDFLFSDINIQNDNEACITPNNISALLRTRIDYIHGPASSFAENDCGMVSHQTNRQQIRVIETSA